MNDLIIADGLDEQVAQAVLLVMDGVDKPMTPAEVTKLVMDPATEQPSYSSVLWTIRVLENKGILVDAGIGSRSAGPAPLFVVAK